MVRTLSRRQLLKYQFIIYSLCALTVFVGNSISRVHKKQQVRRQLDTIADSEDASIVTIVHDIFGVEDPWMCTTDFDTKGGLVIYIAVVLYTFIGMAIVCDEYFCESLDKISEALRLSEDVAGATFMAAGSSAPELFTALVTIYMAPGDSGVGTIVGSAVFNLCVIVGLSCLCANDVLNLFWWPLTRDSAVYCLSILAMLLTMADGKMTSLESFTLVLLYLGYLAIMVVNPRIVHFIKKGQMRRSPAGVSQSSAQRPDIPPPALKYLETQRARASFADLPGLEALSRAETNGTNDDIQLLSLEAATQSHQGGPGESLCVPATERTEEAVATKGEEKEGDESEEEEGLGSKILAFISKPIEFAFAYTIPDCRTDRWANWYFMTFTMSIVWIGLLSFVMVDFADRAACILNVPELVIGLLVLSVGTSVPDALSSIIVAKQGHGNMAVCNALGSNIFNILLGLGLPWWIKTLQTGTPYKVPGFNQIGEPILLLLGFLALFFVILNAGQWKLKPSVGWALLACQAVYTVWELLRNLPAANPIIKF
mmetsp:Transcript_10264/g.17207  ORF Transcript_10264/g.17207 Transcript_10264/m.17207 type:complete len:541 (-) Transcript_10264:572-2194(-)